MAAERKEARYQVKAHGKGISYANLFFLFILILFVLFDVQASSYSSTDQNNQCDDIFTGRVVTIAQESVGAKLKVTFETEEQTLRDISILPTVNELTVDKSYHVSLRNGYLCHIKAI